MAHSTVNLKNRYLAALLAWMVPGLGHFYQGRIGKGFLYAGSILGLFVAGMVLGNGQILYWRWVNPVANTEIFCFNYLGQFWAGLPAFPALIQGTLKYYGREPILLGGWAFMAEPNPPSEFNGIYASLGKLVEIGTLYTTVAGLLNILAIYDAFEGPAHSDDEDDELTPLVLETKAQVIEVAAIS